MMPFTLETARSEADALRAAAQGARFIAGGTTLVDLMREHVEQPVRLVDINALPLSQIGIDADVLAIGALARMADVAAHPLVTRLHPLIAESIVEGATPQLRNMASIGGNLLQRVRCPYFRMLDAACNKRDPGSGCAANEGRHGGHAILGRSEHCCAAHPSDLAVALVALDATVRVRGAHGEREFPVEALYRLPGDTPHLEHTLEPGEMIVEIRVPPLPWSTTGRYLKVRDRESYEFALVSAAAALQVRDGVIAGARLACGGVGTRPWRMRAAETWLRGHPANRSSFEAAAAICIADASPLPGNRFKVELLRRTVIRTLELAGERS
ncbi:xanthine dehydrogenase family protein subunit M [Cupriavidus sp. AU9028]|uniref:FAD binding domain-containing protein n=1 Tax=Cupriavidus sp. AU9028 TaxID=2871157 RepID=UPI001C986941|nr:xanthine dehydrogenase family protein subunit M [Cupriavidus sp. AU9028]MBY4899166.1 xanthine dehydrogenase family protein subunit M [Cupriavidus sp. AU9028]